MALRISFKLPAKAVLSGILYKQVKNPIKYQAAWISHKDCRQDRPPKPPPYPYKEKTFSVWDMIFDPMMHRIDENSKIIVIDGPPAAGKKELAKKLAAEYDMFYLAPPSFDEIFITPYGFDYRTLNDRVPLDCQANDVDTFLTDPHHRNVTAMQFSYYYLRVNKYCDALTHMMSTGEGVVTVRTPWSDIPFTTAMRRNGYISKVAFKRYLQTVDTSAYLMQRPHVVIYLDTDVEQTMKNIKKRNNPIEVNSKALTEKYLKDLEDSYKNDYLRPISSHSRLLVYDWNEGGDFELMCEDIEKLDFKVKYKDFETLADWQHMDNDAWHAKRQWYTARRNEILHFCKPAFLDMTEMLISGGDHEKWEEIVTKEVPEFTRDVGYVTEKGDKNIIWKSDYCAKPDFVLAQEKEAEQQVKSS